MLTSLICRVAGHSINRKRVWDDGLNYRTTCRTCRGELIRLQGGWTGFDTMRDEDSRREPHPSQRA